MDTLPDRLPDRLPDKTVLRVRSTADLLALVPVTLGFEPVESLVVVATAGAQPGFQARVDLPRRRDAGAVADQLTYACLRQGCTRVAVIAFSGRARPAEQALRTTTDRLRSGGLDVLDALRTDGSCYWSLLCTDHRCCPPTGTPYDPRSTTLRADAVLAGRLVAPDRPALAERYAAVTGAGLPVPARRWTPPRPARSQCSVCGGSASCAGPAPRSCGRPHRSVRPGWRRCWTSCSVRVRRGSRTGWLTRSPTSTPPSWPSGARSRRCETSPGPA